MAIIAPVLTYVQHTSHAGLCLGLGRRLVCALDERTAVDLVFTLLKCDIVLDPWIPYSEQQQKETN